MQHTVELYGARTGNCWRAAIALGEAGIPYAVNHLDLRLREQRGPLLIGFNPRGKVPTLVDLGEPPFVLTQSIAIVFYASERVPGSLLPAEIGPSRTLALERFFYFLTDVVGHEFGAIILRSERNLAGSAILLERVISGLEWADRFVVDSQFMAGSRFSMADIAAYTVAFAVESRIEWDQFPNLFRWFEEVGQRPAVISGIHAFDSEPGTRREPP